MEFRCAFKDCNNIATGKCSGSQNCLCGNEVYNDEGYAFQNNCGEYFCTKHLKWGWGCLCINGCIADKQCPTHHTGIYCCVIL